MWCDGRCDVCGNDRKVAVASLPGMPVSVARCAACYQADAVPLWAAVANTVQIGGMANAADWWLDTVEATLSHLGISRDAFNKMVEEMNRDWDAQMVHDGEA